jgi:hypothetical protein
MFGGLGVRRNAAGRVHRMPRATETIQAVIAPGTVGEPADLADQGRE